MRRTLVTWLLACVFAALSHGGAQAISVGEVDTFASGLEGWTQGQPSTAVSRVSFGGPDGGPYLRVIADSTASQGRIVVFNQLPAWTGDYLAAGVSSITMDVNNLGATDLSLRLVLGNALAPMSGGSWFSSTAPVNLPAASGWMSVEFPLGPDSVTLVNGDEDYATVMSSVVTLRLLHATAPASVGNLVTATLGVDNITAVGVAPVIGDFDGDSVVDGADLAQWQSDFGSPGSDADNDGDSDGNDFLIWQRQLSAPPVISAPEPPAALVMLGAVVIVGSVRNAYRRA
jgi:hypothetical protein